MNGLRHRIPCAAVKENFAFFWLHLLDLKFSKLIYYWCRADKDHTIGLRQHCLYKK